jgi:hypothetical protein
MDDATLARLAREHDRDDVGRPGIAVMDPTRRCAAARAGYADGLAAATPR